MVLRLLVSECTAYFLGDGGMHFSQFCQQLQTAKLSLSNNTSNANSYLQFCLFRPVGDEIILKTFFFCLELKYFREKWIPKSPRQSICISNTQKACYSLLIGKPLGTISFSVWNSPTISFAPSQESPTSLCSKYLIFQIPPSCGKTAMQP